MRKRQLSQFQAKNVSAAPGIEPGPLSNLDSALPIELCDRPWLELRVKPLLSTQLTYHCSTLQFKKRYKMRKFKIA